MKKDLTLSLSYYNDEDYLFNHTKKWKEYNKLINLQIIDDCSNESIDQSSLFEELIEMNVSLYRILEDIVWNIPGVRNLGASVANSEWILFCDMDQYFEKKEIKKIVNLLKKEKLDKNNFYSFQRKNGVRTAGTMLMTKDLFWSCGGYDEDLVGNYGHNDPLLREQLISIGSKEVVLENIICQQIKADCALDRSGNSINEEKFKQKIKNLPRKEMNILRFSWEKIH
jgi:predicted glycosyltransferase involved in capsule biosynthesis